MRIARIVLLLAASMFGVFGVWLLLAPEKMGDWSGIQATLPTAKTELRAFYGGLEIGLAMFFLAAWLRPKMAVSACLCLGIVMAGVSLSRMLGFLLDGSACAEQFVFLAIEALFAALGFLGYATANAEASTGPDLGG